jgi:aerobic carbon-monoxide dehydrogenase medium subunit
MKPAPFDHVAARSADDVVAALADGDTHVLAGGQSLVLEMNFRTARPRRLVDINPRLPEFVGIFRGRAERMCW